ncbi:MAG: DUF6273 domain-containing protein [Oscillospiraceae bacterium]|nr:DUF6273 domain-containing protein [Oscillospiraceae bacterium]
MPRRIKLFICAGIICVLSITVFFIVRATLEPDKAELWELVYKRKGQNPDRYTVYIQEDGVYEPYLVIDGDYDGGVLLLRKYLTEEMSPYKITHPYGKGDYNGSRGGYYPLSDVDAFLNTDFIEKFPQWFQDMIRETNILVSTSETVRGGSKNPRETETIQRKIFLLSVKEVKDEQSRLAAVEGTVLRYFRYRTRLKERIATLKDGTAKPHWLRSAYLWNDIKAWLVGWNGQIGGGSVSSSYPLRPTFCLSLNTPIQPEEIDGRKAYVITAVP